ncbi:hypothetical protein GGG16DRAFT_51356 [Schizophyllum commune]
MAALSLHNAIFSPTTHDGPSLSPSASNSENSHHDRARSASTPTLTPSAGEYAHPTEPLLRAETGEALAYLELLSRQPKHPDAPPEAWDKALSLQGDPASPGDRKVFWESAARRRLRRFRWIKLALEAIVAIWAVYSAVRYFMAFSHYWGTVPRALTAAMGACATVSAALIMLNMSLCVAMPSLLVPTVSWKGLLRLENVAAYAGSLLFAIPTIVNLALVNVWHNSPDIDVSLSFRCHLDVDILWAVGGSCEPPTWETYLGLAVMRLVLSFAIVVSLTLVFWNFIDEHFVYKYQTIRRPALTLSNLKGQPNAAHMTQSTVSTPFTDLPTPRRRDRRSHGSHGKTASSAKSATDRGPSHRHSATSLSTGENSPSEEDSDEVVTPRASHNDTDQELRVFAERFRTLMAEISEEADDAVAYARPDSALGYNNEMHADEHSPTDSEFLHGRNGEFDPYVYDASYQPHPLQGGTPFIGRDEFGRPYPPDGLVRVLNGYVRRMPTIESLGSRECGWSRPATRTTMFSMQTGGSEGGRSRANSLNALAMTPTSEAGGGLEAALAEDGRQSRGTESSASRADSMGRASGRTGGTHPSASSRSTNSFYSATGEELVSSPTSTETHMPPPRTPPES